MKLKKEYNKGNWEVYQLYLDSNKARNFETMGTIYSVCRSNTKIQAIRFKKWLL